MDATFLVSAWNSIILQLCYVFTEATARTFQQIVKFGYHRKTIFVNVANLQLFVAVIQTIILVTTLYLNFYINVVVSC